MKKDQDPTSGLIIIYGGGLIAFIIICIVAILMK
jgi:hypothetical protein